MAEKQYSFIEYFNDYLTRKESGTMDHGFAYPRNDATCVDLLNKLDEECKRYQNVKRHVSCEDCIEAMRSAIEGKCDWLLYLLAVRHGVFPVP
jgi:hypothetical protein